MDATKGLEFTLQRKEVPVTIDGEPYILQELDGRERDQYLNNLGSRLRVTKSGKPSGLKSYDGLQSTLVSKSLKKLVNGEQQTVQVNVIQTWPASVISDLYDTARELSGLDDEDGDDKDDEGNA